MNRSPDIVLTNDDGIDRPGIRALYDALADVGDVTVVAPATNQSAVGRALSYDVEVREHELGYAVEGTPSDCVVAAMDALVPDPDVVVSGCNKGANLGMYVLGRSGTVSAAVEASFFGVPAIAASLYVPSDDFSREHGVDAYAEAAEATRYLVERTLGTDVFEHADYLNVNAPRPDGDRRPEMVVTRPSLAYDMGATYDGERVAIHDYTWESIGSEAFDGEEGTDRDAIRRGDVSVSPLTAPHTTEHHESLDGLAAEY